jgi:hypothetical protein
MPRLFDHHKNEIRAQDARRREARSDGSERRTDEWYLEQAKQTQARERAASMGQGEGGGDGGEGGEGVVEEVKREGTDAIERAIAKEIEATQVCLYFF